MLINFDNYKDKLAKLDIYDSEDLSKYLMEEKKIIMVGGKNFGIEDQLVLRYSFVEITDIDMEILDYNTEKIDILLFLLKEWLK
jgi:aspartate/methionine/tyrosine aminotransferase